MKNFKFSLIWPIILSLLMLCDQQCHAMLAWDKDQQKHIEISVDDFFTKKPVRSTETYFESFAHFAEHQPTASTNITLMQPHPLDNRQEDRRGVKAFWIPERLEYFGDHELNASGRFVESSGKSERTPFFGLNYFLCELFNRMPELELSIAELGRRISSNLPVHADKVRVVFKDELERIEFGNRLYAEICEKLKGQAGFNDEIREEFRKRLNCYATEFPELVRPMPGCFYGSQARFWIGSSFVLTFGLSLIGFATHYFRKNVEDVTEQEKSDRKKAIICSAVLAAIFGGLFAASYWELGSHYDYKRFFNIPPA